MPGRTAAILLCLLAFAARGPVAAEDDRAPAPESAPTGSQPSTSEVDVAAIDTSEAAYQFALAKLLAEESAFGEAQEAFERTLELDATDPYSFLEAAKFHFELAFLSRSAERRRQQLLEAAELAGEAVRLAPENHDALSQYAQVHFRLGEHQLSSLDVAQETLEKLREAGESDIQLLITLGQIYFMKRQPERAVGVMREASTLLPDHRMVQSMLVEALVASGQVGELDAALEKLIGLDPSNLDERLRLAELRRENGDHRGAAEVLRTAPDDLRQDPRLRRALAQLLYLTGENESALEITDGLIEDQPGAADVKRLRVSLLTSMARYGEAIDGLRPLIGEIEDPSRRLQESAVLSRLLERVGRADEAIRVLETALAESTEETSVQIKMALAGVLERHGRAAEAIEMLESELAAAGAGEMGVFGAALSEILDRAGRSDEALAVLGSVTEAMEEAGNGAATAGIELRKLGILAAGERWQEIVDRASAWLHAENPDLKSAAYRLVPQALAELGRLDEALALLEPKAAEPSPSSDEPPPVAEPSSSAEPAAAQTDVNERLLIATRVDLLMGHGREDEALALLDQVIAGGGTNDLFFAARLFQQAERYGSVVELMERLLASEPESLQALFMLGSAREREGALDQAVTAFRKLLELDPDHAPTLNYLGYMWAEKGENLEEALGLILRAVALDPDNGAYVDSLGWAFHQMGRFEEARVHLEWAARLLPTDPTILEHLGDLYLRLDEVSRARDYYRQALDLGAENLDEVRRKLEGLGEKGP